MNSVGQPKLSVVVTFHNQQRYAPQTMRSLIANAAAEIEYVLIDDGSRDGTGEMIAHLATRLPRVRILTNVSAVGVAQARNQAMLASRGDWVTFHDGDDWVGPERYPQLVAKTVKFGQLGCDLLRTDLVRARGTSRVPVYLPTGARSGRLSVPRSEILPVRRTTSVDVPSPCTFVVRRDLIESGTALFDPTLATAEDRAWSWKLHLQAQQLTVVDGPWVFYRLDAPGSLTKRDDLSRIAFTDAIARIDGYLAEDEDRDRFTPKVIRTLLGIFAYHELNPGQMSARTKNQLRSAVARQLDHYPADTVAELIARLPQQRQFAVRRGLART